MEHLSTNDEVQLSATTTVNPFPPAKKHWFFKRKIGKEFVWTPFTYLDSGLLEAALIAQSKELISVEGGRYDVDILARRKLPVFWEGNPIEIKRCSWFYKGEDSKLVPFDETTADLLEAEFQKTVEANNWHRKITIAKNEQVVFHSPILIAYLQNQKSVDTWGGPTQVLTNTCDVKRDLNDFTIEQGESERVDQLLFAVHGIGVDCDLKLRSLEEVVDEFRSIAQELVQLNYKSSIDMGNAGRVEVLPISWHSDLHSEEMGIDERLRSITLESLPKLRSFTNDTLLDILFYTSPIYSEKIINTVAAGMNNVYKKYCARHPNFKGGVSVIGHSLGSVILFDLLCQQNNIKDKNDVDDSMLLASAPISNLETAKKQQLIFQPKDFYALGSPISMFLTVRGTDELGLDFHLPTCNGFFNIFHPYDPVAYRIESLINPKLTSIDPVLIPHYKGGKRIHLELKERIKQVGADLKIRFMDTFKATFSKLSFRNEKKNNDHEEPKENLNEPIQLAQLENEQLDGQQLRDHITDDSEEDEDEENDEHSFSYFSSKRNRVDNVLTADSDAGVTAEDIPVGKLNNSRRMDFVLQEGPLEFFNEYIFAISSHVCYWDSKDTILFILKEVYSGLGINPDEEDP